jgi:hypothetical protein
MTVVVSALLAAAAAGQATGSPLPSAPPHLQPPQQLLPPHAVFINLDARPDRRARVEAELAAAGWPADRVHRLAATAHAHGALGCAHSHVAALDAAWAAGWPAVAVFEDDVVFRRPWGSDHGPPSPAARVAAVVAWGKTRGWGNWSVVLASGIKRAVEPDGPPPPHGGPHPPPGLAAASGYQTTAAYLVRRGYIPTLRGVFVDAAAALAAADDDDAGGGATPLSAEARAARRASADDAHAIDQAWKPAQAADGWARFHPLLADQAPGHSDIAGGWRDYVADFGDWEEARARAAAGEHVTLLVRDGAGAGGNGGGRRDSA